MSAATTAARLELRETLRMPSRAARYWRDMDGSHRRILCQAAGLPDACAFGPWDKLRGYQQGAIRKAARRAADWAQGLGALL